MNTTLMLISRYMLDKPCTDKELDKLVNSEDIQYFTSVDEGCHDLIELRIIRNFDDILQVNNQSDKNFQVLTPLTTHDVRRELLTFIESPLGNSSTGLPNTEYIQLRHIEVKPQTNSDYLEWRNRTIFEVVKSNKDVIDVFDAYHSLVSGQPGVMFVSGFNGDLESYLSVFSSDRYMNIVEQAGDNYIAGGKEGLYTYVYKACKKGSTT